ncbi:MAG: metallophosphoesterase [Nitriliruptoraceae bacterium]
MSPAMRVTAAVLAAGVGCVAYGTFVERRWYALRRVTVPGVLRGGGRLRILHVSDVHLVPGQDHRVRFLEELSGEDHDLVVATGDLMGAAEAADATVAALAPLTREGRPGLVVLGSNDLYGPVVKSPLSYFLPPRRRAHGARLDTQRMIDGLAAHGYRTLCNEAVTLDTPAGTVVAGGIDDPHLDTTVMPTADEVAGPPVDDAVLRLGLVHAPYLEALDVLVEAGHDLLMAGHTHGGQVRLPPIGALVGNCDLPLDQVRGLSRYRDRWLHVSAGLGHSRYAPFRFACRPEATILDLT